MSDEQTARARDQVRDLLGSVLAGKASDAFCNAYARPSPAALTSAGDDGRPRAMRVVVELRPEAPLAALRGGAVARLRGSAPLDEALASARTLVREHAGEHLGPRVDTLLNPAALVRQACVTEMRERCFRAAGPIREELDRGYAALRGPGQPAAAALPGSAVQFSWLNQSFLAWTDLETLAALAAHPGIAWIDMPRPVELQIKVTGDVMGAVKHRKVTQHGGLGVRVAVIDSEVALLDEVFQQRVHHMADFTGEGWGHPDLHGTTVAGIIAANGKGASGMAPDAVIYSYKIVKTNSVTRMEDIQGARALGQALEDGADIANCSWGTEAPTDGRSREVRACDNAWACGMTVVQAAGNRGSSPGVMCPSDAAGVIVVGATGRNGNAVQPYSGRGPALNGKRCPDVVAPGGNDNVNIESFLPGGTFGKCGHGTSFAAPHVSGILALLLEPDRGLTPDEQFQRLKALCTKRRFANENAQGLGLPSLDRLHEPH